MEVDVKPGRYVVAVSGGVDSVVLLHLLQKKPDISLYIAHYDHGIRPDSTMDRMLVEGLAKQYSVAFLYETDTLGPTASEATARAKRYAFLRKVKQQVAAKAIITAHHQDDLIETAILNQLRGTGRRGLSSLKSSYEILRPLLTIPKTELIAYAIQNNLQWREDSTNLDERYRRNYVRKHITPKLSLSDRADFVTILQKAAEQNELIDKLLQETLLSHVSAEGLDRQWFMSLPHAVARETLLAWLRQVGHRNLDRRRTERLVVLAKTLPRGKLIDVDAGFQLHVAAQNLALIARER